VSAQQFFTFSYPDDGEEPIVGQVTYADPYPVPLHSPGLGRRLSATDEEYPIARSNMVRTVRADTVDFHADRDDGVYEASSSVQELPPPLLLAEEGWGHAQCEEAFNSSCWAKGRFVDKNHPERSCCRDCAKEWSRDTCHWGWSSELHGKLSGAFNVSFGHTGKACYHACMTISSETFSALDFCNGAVLANISGCQLAVKSVKNAMAEKGWNTAPEGVCTISNVSTGRSPTV